MTPEPPDDSVASWNGTCGRRPGRPVAPASHPDRGPRAFPIAFLAGSYTTSLFLYAAAVFHGSWLLHG